MQNDAASNCEALGEGGGRGTDLFRVRGGWFWPVGLSDVTIGGKGAQKLLRAAHVHFCHSSNMLCPSVLSCPGQL